MNPKQQQFGLEHAAIADVRIVWPDGERLLNATRARLPGDDSRTGSSLW